MAKRARPRPYSAILDLAIQIGHCHCNRDFPRPDKDAEHLCAYMNQAGDAARGQMALSSPKFGERHRSIQFAVAVLAGECASGGFTDAQLGSARQNAQ